MSDFSGQWIGKSKGDPPGGLLLNLETVSAGIKGTISLFPTDSTLPSSMARLSFSDSSPATVQGAQVAHFISDTGYIPTWPELDASFPGVQLPVYVDATVEILEPEKLRIEWETPVGTGGKAVLKRKNVPVHSSIIADPKIRSWIEFKAFVERLEPEQFVFRGQSRPWPLATSFHRKGRTDLDRYRFEDIPRLHRATSSRLSHVFDLEKQFELGAFLNLAQHHGFPTPLLDWTYSPYVAAFFAFSTCDEEQKEPVRIFHFDYASYTIENAQRLTMASVLPHFSFLEALSIENDRATPQQGLLSLSNLADIENFIGVRESEKKNRYLYAVDLPAGERDSVMSELRLMGITKATMFPGLDSICEELSNRYF